MVAQLVRYKAFNQWFAGLPVEVAAEIAAALNYLCEHGRGAALPIVRHRIQISKKFPDMSEIRTDHVLDGKRYVMRVLTCFVDNDSRILVCLGGNKHGWEEENTTDWYEAFVPIADEITDMYLGRGEKK